jgi:DNA modification methylase
MTESKIIQGDCLSVLKTMESSTVNCCVTSPPYYGLRDYGMSGQLGLEPTPEEYVANLVSVFRECKRILREDGTLWVNIGDSYHHTQSNNGGYSEKSTLAGFSRPDTKGRIANETGNTVRLNMDGLKPKDLIGIPWMLAFALRADGWYLRQDIIWSKPNPMPESVSDRCTKSHEYIFLLSKSSRYYFNSESIKEKASPDTSVRDRDNTKLNNCPGRTKMGGLKVNDYEFRNKRSVWTIATQPCKESHFATFPKELIRPCIKAGCPVDGIVIDPFLGSGTTACVCIEENRKYLGIELNPEYIKIAQKRINSTERNGLIIFKEESE